MRQPLFAMNLRSRSEDSCGSPSFDEIGQLRLDPFVLVTPDDESRRLDLSVLVLIQISLVHRACQSKKVLGAILSDERSEITRDELHRHVFLISDAAFQNAFQQRRCSHHPASETE